MAYLRILSWFISICIALALQVQAVDSIKNAGKAFSAPYSGNSVSASAADANSESCAVASHCFYFKDTVRARRRVQDRHSVFYFNPVSDKAADIATTLTREVGIGSSVFNNICLSSCYDFIFMLSPF